MAGTLLLHLAGALVRYTYQFHSSGTLGRYTLQVHMAGILIKVAVRTESRLHKAG